MKEWNMRIDQIANGKKPRNVNEFYRIKEVI